MRILCTKWLNSSMKRWLLKKIDKEGNEFHDALLMLEEEMEPYDFLGQKQRKEIGEQLRKVAIEWLKKEVEAELKENKYPIEKLSKDYKIAKKPGADHA